jgi:uncharacterized membrane protein
MWNEVNDALRHSVSRAMAGLAGVLPGIVAMLLALLLAAIIGWLLSRACAGILGRVGFDARMERFGRESLADWSPERSPTLLVGRFVFWVTMALGFFVGLAALDATMVSVFATRLVEFIPNVFAAALLLVAGSVLARYLSRSTLISAVNMQVQSARLISLGVKWMVLLLAAAMALHQLSIGGQILTLAFGILFGGIVLALALAVGLGSKDVVSRTWEQQATKGQERATPTDSLAQHL